MSDSTHLSLIEAVHKATAELDEMRRRVEERRKEMADRQAQLAEDEQLLRSQESLVNSLRIAAERYNAGDLPPAAVDEMTPEDWWAHAPRTMVVIKALEHSDHPMGPVAITEYLHAHGRSDDSRAVSASLSYLSRIGQVKSLGYGKWVLEASNLQPTRFGADFTTSEETADFLGGAPG